MAIKRTTLEKALTIEAGSARSHYEQGNFSVAADAGTLAVTSALAIAVNFHAQPEEGIKFLHEVGTSALITLARRSYDRLFEGTKAGEGKADEVGGNYLLLVLAQCSQLVEMDHERDWFVRMGSDPDRVPPSTPFWAEYGRGLKCLGDGAGYIPHVPRLTGLELYWEAQLHLIHAMTSGGGVDAALSRCREAFEKQQADRSLPLDSYGIEGGGKAPVKWSFRIESFRVAPA